MTNPELKLSSIDLWEHYERLCLSLLREALQSWAYEEEPEHEDNLNRQLYFALGRASRRVARSGIFTPSVVYEGRNPPAAVHSSRVTREYKRPDFYWAYTDPYAADVDDSFKHFVVECKRLRNPLTLHAGEYVDLGIMRFVTVDHGYAWGAKTGAMVGYLEGVPIDDALRETNATVVNQSISELSENARDGENFAEFSHHILRSFPESPFHLVHIWTRVGSTQGQWVN